MNKQPKDKIDVVVKVSHGPKGFACTFGGGADADGNVSVENPKNHHVRICYTLQPEGDVEAATFHSDAKKAIRVGPCNDKTCPPAKDSSCFDEHKTGNKDSTVRIRNKVDEFGEFQYLLSFVARAKDGAQETVKIDPKIINK